LEIDKKLALLSLFVLVIVTSAGCISKDGGSNGGNGDIDETNQWSDLSLFHSFLKQGYSTQVTLSSTEVDYAPEPPKSLLVVVGFEKEFTEDEISSIKWFVKNGGHVLIADDGTLSQALAQYYQVDYSDQHYQMLDHRYVKNWDFIPVEGRIGSTVYDILLNDPSPINCTAPSKGVLIETKNFTTTEFTVLDINDNGEMDLHDVVGPFTICVTVYQDMGSISFLGGTGMLINDLWERDDYQNKNFIQSFVASKVSQNDGYVILDVGKQLGQNSGHYIYGE